jgi:hypothetical protein
VSDAEANPINSQETWASIKARGAAVEKSDRALGQVGFGQRHDAVGRGARDIQTIFRQIASAEAPSRCRRVPGGTEVLVLLTDDLRGRQAKLVRRPLQREIVASTWDGTNMRH